jgi:hypothetical protein
MTRVCVKRIETVQKSIFLGTGDNSPKLGLTCCFRVKKSDVLEEEFAVVQGWECCVCVCEICKVADCSPIWLKKTVEILIL